MDCLEVCGRASVPLIGEPPSSGTRPRHNTCLGRRREPEAWRRRRRRALLHKLNSMDVVVDSRADEYEYETTTRKP